MGPRPALVITALLFPQAALAYLPLPEATGFFAGALRPLWFPDQALAMLALALVVAPFPTARLRTVLPVLAIGIAIGLIGTRIEHLPIRSVTGDTVAFEIGDVAGQRGRTEPRPLMANDARLDDDTPLKRASALLKRSPLAAS